VPGLITQGLSFSLSQDVLIGEAQESSQTTSLDMVDTVRMSDFALRLSPTEVGLNASWLLYNNGLVIQMEDSGSSYERPPHETDELPLSSGSVGRGLQPHVNSPAYDQSTLSLMSIN
jgi:hypothetical protein